MDALHTDDRFNAGRAFRNGAQHIYPGSHELRLEALIPMERNLAPEDFLALASFEKTGELTAPVSARTPAQTEELLCEVVFAICRQMQQSRDLLSMLGHHIPANLRAEALCLLVQGHSLQS
ncbi:hypothetical protein HGG72_19060 [Ochrobactrum pecoris]|uniref:Uncharacterized protein n=1 Tax=Brucella pecoris TaxID=867683 RepID=A0A5C5CWT8_9HYPH|nr:hypothetical protein [Brucella pecoris]MBB4092385.1 hypothetical protein [Brucella pecoris]NKW81941.1 hypothetical protein [Brucella pecoris]TNV15196.1 hypothetical protein FIB18_00070 [Brucella pecoris]